MSVGNSASSSLMKKISWSGEKNQSSLGTLSIIHESVTLCAIVLLIQQATTSHTERRVFFINVHDVSACFSGNLHSWFDSTQRYTLGSNLSNNIHQVFVLISCSSQCRSGDLYHQYDNSNIKVHCDIIQHTYSTPTDVSLGFIVCLFILVHLYTVNSNTVLVDNRHFLTVCKFYSFVLRKIL